MVLQVKTRDDFLFDRLATLYYLLFGPQGHNCSIVAWKYSSAHGTRFHASYKITQATQSREKVILLVDQSPPQALQVGDICISLQHDREKLLSAAQEVSVFSRDTWPWTNTVYPGNKVCAAADGWTEGQGAVSQISVHLHIDNQAPRPAASQYRS